MQNRDRAQGISTDPSGSKKKNRLLIIGMIVVFLLLLTGGAFFLLQTPEEAEITVTPEPNNIQQTTEPTSTPEPIDKSEVRIDVLNGTGLGGEAAHLQEILESMGYEDIEVGNADETDHETTLVTFSEDFPETDREELLGELRDEYQDVEVESGELEEFDIRIITGLRTGQTPIPEETEAPASDTDTTESPTPTPADESTPTPTSTPSE